MTTTLHERPTTRAEELELAGLLLSTLPRLGKMAMHAGEQNPISANRAGVMWQLRERAMRSGELDQPIVGTALPRIVAELNGLDFYAWVATGYLVTSTTLTPIAGKLGDLFGRKSFVLAGMIGFVLASALCGQAQNMAELVGFRA